MEKLLKTLNMVSLTGPWREVTVYTDSTKIGIDEKEITFFVNEQIKNIWIVNSSYDTKNVIFYKDGTKREFYQDNLEISNGIIQAEFLQEIAEEFLNSWKRNNQEFQEFLKEKKIKELERKLAELKNY